MKREVLIVITSKENKTYINNFKKIVSDTSPRLKIDELTKIYSKKPVIGQVLKNCFGYEKVLSLERLETLKSEKHEYDSKYRAYTGLWLVVKHLNGENSLGIGSKNKNVEIFQEVDNKSGEQYSLSDTTFHSGEITKWVKPSQVFLQKTLKLLPGKSQAKFKGLVT
jgi:hypothetical protein